MRTVHFRRPSLALGPPAQRRCQALYPPRARSREAHLGPPFDLVVERLPPRLVDSPGWVRRRPDPSLGKPHAPELKPRAVQHRVELELCGVGPLRRQHPEERDRGFREERHRHTQRRRRPGVD